MKHENLTGSGMQWQRFRTVLSFGEFSVKWTLWDAVPRQIDVNIPVFFSGASAGIFRWLFESNKIFPQTDGNYPTLYFCSLNVSHKLTGIIQHFTLFTEFFPQTNMIFPTNRHKFSIENMPDWEKTSWPYMPGNPRSSAEKRHYSCLVKPNFIF